jgi:hypothetical protein
VYVRIKILRSWCFIRVYFLFYYLAVAEFGRRLMMCQFPIRLPAACLSIPGRLQRGTRLVPTRATTPLAIMICQQR